MLNTTGRNKASRRFLAVRNIGESKATLPGKLFDTSKRLRPIPHAKCKGLVMDFIRRPDAAEFKGTCMLSYQPFRNGERRVSEGHKAYAEVTGNLAGNAVPDFFFTDFNGVEPIRRIRFPLLFIDESRVSCRRNKRVHRAELTASRLDGLHRRRRRRHTRRRPGNVQSTRLPHV